MSGPLRRRVLHPRHLLTGIKLRARYDLTVLDDDNAPLDGPPDRVPDCAACRDKCCADPDNETVLRLVDIARLLDAGLGEHILPADGEHPPRLKKRPDGACVFLDPDERCSIYADRPVVCRRFPYRVADDRRRVTVSSLCASFADGDAEPLVNDARLSYNWMITDLATLAYGEQELRALGLWAYVAAMAPG